MIDGIFTHILCEITIQCLFISHIKCSQQKFTFFFLQIPPPFKPQVNSDTDTRYFDSEFTGESVELTPPEQHGPLGAIQEEPMFSQV